MSVRPYRDIHRRQCRQIYVGKVPVGGDAPITVQSMTNTVTHDVRATVEQVQALERAGADIVRVSCPDQESALALKHIVRQVEVPIVADIHFHYKRAIEAAESGAACLRINPGNIGSATRVREVIKAAKDHGCSMRIGVNAGSLERHLLEKYGEPNPEALVESALYHVLGFIQTLVAVGKHVTVIIQNLSVFGINVQNFFELLFGFIELFLALINCAEQKPGGFIFPRLAGKHFGLFCGGFGILIAMAALVDLRNVQIYFAIGGGTFEIGL